MIFSSGEIFLYAQAEVDCSIKKQIKKCSLATVHDVHTLVVLLPKINIKNLPRRAYTSSNQTKNEAGSPV